MRSDGGGEKKQSAIQINKQERANKMTLTGAGPPPPSPGTLRGGGGGRSGEVSDKRFNGEVNHPFLPLLSSPPTDN